MNVVTNEVIFRVPKDNQSTEGMFAAVVVIMIAVGTLAVVLRQTDAIARDSQCHTFTK
jgi:hypothetical protein